MRKSLIVIVAAISAVPLIAACAAAAGHPHSHQTAHDLGTDLGLVTGKFERVGGPLGPGGKQPPVVALRGTVTFTAAHQRTALVRVGNSGRFSVRLAPGRYRVTGRTPDIEGPGHVEAVCQGPVSLTVSAGHTSAIKVICAVP
jgi:hypothetical protein